MSPRRAGGIGDSSWVTCTKKVTLILVEDFVVYDQPPDPDRKSIWLAVSSLLQLLKDFLSQYFSLRNRQASKKIPTNSLFFYNMNSKFCKIFFHFQLLAIQDKCAVYGGGKCIKFPKDSISFFDLTLLLGTSFVQIYTMYMLFWIK